MRQLRPDSLPPDWHNIPLYLSLNFTDVLHIIHFNVPLKFAGSSEEVKDAYTIHSFAGQQM
jgi:hypothetical protein